ncbi:MAG: CBS domain-containing protein [Candidatus Thorarchaeota archaeon]|jgi:CBS domain-containing protein
MTSLIITSEAETPVKEAAKLMAAEDIGSLLVTKGDLLAGMVTRKEFIGARLLSDDAYSSLTVEDIMTSPVITISPDADLGQTIAVMNQAGVKCLPVIEGDSIIGVVSTSDVIRVLATMKHLADGASE